MKIGDIGEIKLIERLTRKTSRGRSILIGIGDDAAVVHWARNEYLLYTCDMLIEDIHFSNKEATPFQIGRKALAVNISDIAAMGGVPKYALVSIGLNPKTSMRFVDDIYRGIRTLATRFNIRIVGGDTNMSQKLVIDISLIGLVKRENLVTRSGARKGDLILVTGEIGGSRKGKHLNFKPRLRESLRLVNRFKISSMIDISDGLVLDLWRLLQASEIGAEIYESAIPISKNADSFGKAIGEGEDFELLFTMSAPEARRFYKKEFFDFGTPVSIIGEILDKREGSRLINKDGKSISLKPEGYTHFPGMGTIPSH